MTDSAEAAAIVRTTIEAGCGAGPAGGGRGRGDHRAAQALLAAGCQLAQGFLFHRPTPVDPMVEMLRAAVPTPRTPLRLVNVDPELPG